LSGRFSFFFFFFSSFTVFMRVLFPLPQSLLFSLLAAFSFLFHFLVDGVFSSVLSYLSAGCSPPAPFLPFPSVVSVTFDLGSQVSFSLFFFFLCPSGIYFHTSLFSLFFFSPSLTVLVLPGLTLFGPLSFSPLVPLLLVFLSFARQECLLPSIL